MSGLRVMILCGQSARHLQFANALCKGADVVAIVHEQGADWSIGKVLRILRPTVFFRKGWRWLRDRRRYAGDPEGRFFFGEAGAKLDRPDLVRTFPSVNHSGVVQLADELQPDLIAVFGTSLIKGPLLKRGRLGIVNLHGGLSPQYRGADCTFWALYNNEADQVGCTIHYIDDGIDTGGLIAHVSPQILTGDGELTLFWRAVRTSTGAFVELLDRLESGERFGQSQPGKGCLYQVKDRLLRHERALAQRMPAGIPPQCTMPARIKWFTVDAPQQVGEVRGECATF